jgi:hypothetical protein
MQLGVMSNMLRGLPMQATSTQSYQAQPSTLQQGIGLVGAAGTLLGGRAEGGVIKMAEGGIAGYKYGGAIPEPKLESMADSLSVAQLQQRIKDPALTPGERQVFQEALAAKQQTAARSSGIAAAGGGLFDTMGYAGGGILAFAGEDGSLVQDPEELVNQINLIGSQLDAINKEASSMSAPGSRQRAFAPEKVAEFENLQKRQGELKSEYAALMSKSGLDKPAFNYQPSRSLGRGNPANPVEQLLSGNKPTTTRAMPTEGEFKAFDEATERYLAEQNAKASAPAGAPPPRASGNAPTGPSAAPAKSKGLEAYMADQERIMGPNTVGQGLEAKIAERLAGMDKRASQDDRAAMRQAFVRLGTEASPGGFLQAATKSVGTYGDARDAAAKVRENMDLELTKMQADIKKGERAEKRGNLDAASKSFENAENRELKIAEMQNQLKVAGIQASRSSEFERQYEAFKADPKKFEQFKKSLTSQDDTARLNAYVKADEFVAKAYPSLMFSKKPEDKAKLEEIRNGKVAEYLGALSKQQVASGGAKGQVDTKNPLLGS